MERDLRVFPEDHNGDALWQAHRRGLKLGRVHRVRFATAFTLQERALELSLHLLRHGYWVQVNDTDNTRGYSAEVLSDIEVDLTYEDIRIVEAWLSGGSPGVAGRNSG